METLDYYRERSFQLEKENKWLEAELSIARSEAQSERSLLRYILTMCVPIMISICVTSAALATALARAQTAHPAAGATS